MEEAPSTCKAAVQAAAYPSMLTKSMHGCLDALLGTLELRSLNHHWSSSLTVSFPLPTIFKDRSTVIGISSTLIGAEDLSQLNSLVFSSAVTAASK